MGVEHGFVRKSGAWYTYESDQLGQGKENARNFLRENPDIANEIEKKIKEKLGVGPTLDSPSGEPPAQAEAAAKAAQAASAGKAASAKRGAKAPPKPGDV